MGRDRSSSSKRSESSSRGINTEPASAAVACSPGWRTSSRNGRSAGAASISLARSRASISISRGMVLLAFTGRRDGARSFGVRTAASFLLLFGLGSLVGYPPALRRLGGRGRAAALRAHCRRGQELAQLVERVFQVALAIARLLADDDDAPFGVEPAAGQRK